MVFSFILFNIFYIFYLFYLYPRLLCFISFDLFQCVFKPQSVLNRASNHCSKSVCNLQGWSSCQSSWCCIYHPAHWTTCFWSYSKHQSYKLDGVGLVDNRLSTIKLDHFIQFLQGLLLKNAKIPFLRFFLSFHRFSLVVTISVYRCTIEYRY